MSATRAVYTAIIGEYERLAEQPVARDSDVPFICLTDDPTLRSETWTVVLVEPRFPTDHVRSARRLKILGGGEPMRDFAETLWIDNRVELLRDPAEILDDWLADDDLAVPDHSFRADLLDEFRAVVDSGFDDPGRVYEQLFHYRRTHPEVLEAKPAWTGMLARRWSPDVRHAMEVWFEDVLRYSRRDQLSFCTALAVTATSRRRIPLDNRASDVHRWRSPESLGRNTRGNDDALVRAIEPPFVVERAATEALQVLRTNLATISEERDDLIRSIAAREHLLDQASESYAGLAQTHDELLARFASLDSQRAQINELLVRNADLLAQSTELDTELAAANSELAGTRREVERSAAELTAARHEIDALLSSTSWRLTAPARAATRVLHRKR